MIRKLNSTQVEDEVEVELGNITISLSLSDARW